MRRINKILKAEIIFIFFKVIFIFFSFFINRLYANDVYYKVKEIKIYGLKYLEKREIIEYLKIEEQKFYQIDFFLNIEEKLKSWGYFSSVTVSFDLEEENNVIINIIVFENKVIEGLYLFINKFKVDSLLIFFKTKVNKPFNPIYLEEDLKNISNIKYFSNLNIDIKEERDSLKIYINLTRKGKFSFGLIMYDSIGLSLLFEQPFIISSYFIGIYSKVYIKRLFYNMEFFNNYFNMPYSFGFFVGLEIFRDFYIFLSYESFLDKNLINLNPTLNYEFLYGIFYFNNKKIKNLDNNFIFSFYNKSNKYKNYLGMDLLEKLKIKKFLFYFSFEFLYIIKSNSENERIFNLTLNNQFIYFTNSNYLTIPFFVSDLSKFNIKYFSDIYTEKFAILFKNSFFYNLLKIYFFNLYGGMFYDFFYYKNNLINLFGINILLNISIFNFSSDIILKYGWQDKFFEDKFFTINFFPVNIFF
ncbi:MAG: hypothetical protein N3A58_02265 [Spirochaetes bacterium]|nr:hypothetical protein [Spirochaetota bacterium]